jgi:hypothetical protein
MKVLLIFTLLGALACGCGGRAKEPGAVVSSSSGGTGSVNAGSADDGSADAGSSGAVSGGNPGPPPACVQAGTRRSATSAEMAQYCLCSPVGGDELAWECYGPSPTAARPETTCTYTSVNQGTGQGSCSVSWEKCSDAQVYAILCIDSYCQCTVQGIPTAMLAPMQTCPESKADLNALCGWKLQ